jgi:stress response protein SCP2
MTLQRGHRQKLDWQQGEIRFHTQGLTQNLSIDFSCFGLDAAGKLSDERYCVFYNQTASPDGAIKLLSGGSNQASYGLDLGKLHPTIDRLVFTAAIDGNGTMRGLGSSHILLPNGLRFDFSGSDFADERALMLLEIYKKDGAWRFSLTAQGFNGGFDVLIKHFGGEVADSPAPPAAVPAAPAAPSRLSLEKKIADKAPALISLAKSLKVNLDKKNLNDVLARVVLVLDVSGSMTGQYQKGKVQKVIDRMLPIAVAFDDDGSLESWCYGSTPKELSPITLDNYAKYVKKEQKGWEKWMSACGYGNDETQIIPPVLAQAVKQNEKKILPTLIIFITDGGIGHDQKIAKLLTDAAKVPVFWQFVGVGGSNYGVLKKLDTMSGRVVDNCGFFELDDIESVTPEVLYDRLLSEFPAWLQVIKAKNMLR